jgi:hypothetical protein
MGLFLPAIGFVPSVRRLTRGVCLLLLAATVALAGGCSVGKTIPSRRLIEHQAVIDFSGLKPAEVNEPLKVNAAVPRTWEQVGPNKHSIPGFSVTHTQWRSPSVHTAVGAAHIGMPLPFSADLLLFLAKQQYTSRSTDGRIIAEWKDELGRSWLEAENNKYHVQGYALAQGFEGWFVYFGYKNDQPPEMSEITLAARSVETFVPLVGGVQPIPGSAESGGGGKPTTPSPASAPASAPAKANARADGQPIVLKSKPPQTQP